MKNLLTSLIVIAAFFLYNCDDKSNNPKADLTVTDIDGNVYKTVRIGNQTWMAENLNVAHYRNGDSIPEIIDNNEWRNAGMGATCLYDHNLALGDLYGRLYNWYALYDARGLAPDGWRIPNDDDWKELEEYLGMSKAEANDYEFRGTDQGSQLAGKADLWIDDVLVKNPNFAKSKFDAVPGGFRNGAGKFYSINIEAYFWTLTEYYNYFAFHRLISSYYSNIYRFRSFKNSGYSVRCIKDK